VIGAKLGEGSVGKLGEGSGGKLGEGMVVNQG
jgi:hypothetical protein